MLIINSHLKLLSTLLLLPSVKWEELPAPSLQSSSYPHLTLHVFLNIQGAVVIRALHFVGGNSSKTPLFFSNMNCL